MRNRLTSIHTASYIAIVLHFIRKVIHRVRVPFRGFAEKDMTKSYRQIARFMEENASEIRKEAELD